MSENAKPTRLTNDVELLTSQELAEELLARPGFVGLIVKIDGGPEQGGQLSMLGSQSLGQFNMPFVAMMFQNLAAKLAEECESRGYSPFNDPEGGSFGENPDSEFPNFGNEDE